ESTEHADSGRDGPGGGPGEEPRGGPKLEPGQGESEEEVVRRAIWGVGIIAAFGPVAMLLAWQGDGQEVTRHMVEGSIEMRLGILLVLLIATLGRRSIGSTTRADELGSSDAT